MNDTQREALNDEWLQCQRTMWDEHIGMDKWNEAHDRACAIEAMLRTEERCMSNSPGQ